MTDESQLVRIAKLLTAGTAGGVACTIVGHPFDTIKVRFQTGNWTSIQELMNFKTLYRGVMAPIVGVAPQWAAGYAGYEVGKSLYEKYFASSESTGEWSASRTLLAGAVSGFCTACVRCPVDVVKIIGQNDGVSSTQALRKVLQQSGLRGLLNGFVPTLIHVIPTSTVFFGSNEIYRNYVFADWGLNDLMLSLVAGGCAGVTEWSLCLPMDTFKTRYQAAAHTSLRVCWRELVQETGGGFGLVRGLYRGMLPMIIRAFPANASAFFMIEYVSSKLR